MCEYGYCRISTPKQSIERQVRNIKKAFPEAVIIKETYSGTKVEGRKQLKLLLYGNNRKGGVKSGDTIIFDSVSRMSRNADEGFKLYKELFNKGVNLFFLKEPHINTDTYKSAIDSQIMQLDISTKDKDTDDLIKGILESINNYIFKLAEKQIRLAFEQAEKEVEDLHRRTSEGIETARLAGKQIGQIKGKKLTTKKSLVVKEIIMKRSKDFMGDLPDTEVMLLAGVARNTYYKYKRELAEEGEIISC